MNAGHRTPQEMIQDHHLVNDNLNRLFLLLALRHDPINPNLNKQLLAPAKHHDKLIILMTG